MHMPNWKLIDPTATNHYMQYGAGGACNTAGLWQLWVTLDGDHINWVTVYREQAHIDTAMQELRQIAATGDLFDLERFRTTLDRLYQSQEADPEPLPQVIATIRSNLRGTGTWK